MNPVIATAGELQRFLSDMRQAHGSVHIHHDNGYPLDIEVDGAALASIAEVDSLPEGCPVTIKGYIAVGQQRGAHSLQRIFRDWQKGQRTVSRIAMVPQDNMDKFEELVRALGGTLIA